MDERAARWCKGYLRISSLLLSAGEISRVLLTEPDETVAKGERLSKRNLASAVSACHIWVLDSHVADSEDVEVHLDALVGFMEQHEAGLGVLEGKCEMDIVCSVDNPTTQRGFLLSAEMIRRLARFPVQLGFDLFG